MASITVSGQVVGVDIPGNANTGTIDVDLRSDAKAGGFMAIQSAGISGFTNGPVTITIAQP